MEGNTFYCNQGYQQYPRYQGYQQFPMYQGYQAYPGYQGYNGYQNLAFNEQTEVNHISPATMKGKILVSLVSLIHWELLVSLISWVLLVSLITVKSVSFHHIATVRGTGWSQVTPRAAGGAATREGVVASAPVVALVITAV